MSVKASISMSEQQDEFVREQVENGRFSGVSAVIQQGLDLLRQKTEAEETDTLALKVLLDERASGPFESSEKFSIRVEQMLAEKRSAHGLEG